MLKHLKKYVVLDILANLSQRSLNAILLISSDFLETKIVHNQVVACNDCNMFFL